MKIGIDIDDTLINTKEQQIIYWKEYISKYPKEGYTEELPTTINDWDDEYINRFWDLYRTHFAFEPTFKKDVAKVLHKLKEEGDILCIITARRERNCPDIKNKIRNWLKENDIPIKTIYTDINNKGLCCRKKKIDVFIDDDIKNITSANNCNIKTIMFNKNPNYNGLQADNWIDVYNILKKLKEEQN